MPKTDTSFFSLITIGVLWLGFAIGCKSGSRTNAPESLSPMPTATSSTPSSNSTMPATAKYFDGSKACKFLADIAGFDLGNYVPYTQTDGYTCQTIEPTIKLSCNPQSDLLCNSISYQVDGEKEGATSAELFYMGTSLSSTAHQKDLPLFTRYCDQLTRQALGVDMDSEMRQYLDATAKFLPMKSEGGREAVERNTLKKKLGSGFIAILGRRNDMTGGSAYMIRFTVYPDEQWMDR